MEWEPIRRSPALMAVSPNLLDYDQTCATFAWESITEKLSGLPGNAGINIAYEAVDRPAGGALRSLRRTPSVPADPTRPWRHRATPRRPNPRADPPPSRPPDLARLPRTGLPYPRAGVRPRPHRRRSRGSPPPCRPPPGPSGDGIRRRFPARAALHCHRQGVPPLRGRRPVRTPSCATRGAPPGVSSNPLRSSAARAIR